MAEIKTGIFAKNVQKRISRAQEKVLQKLGKADETKDEQFEQCVQNFKRQESEGARLQREMKAYIAAVKGMQQASMNLTESLHEVYEPDWHGKDDVMSIGKNCDALWEDFHQKLVDSTILALDTYLAQFPDIKVRVAKRSRKLIDYDSARHHFETLQTSAIKNERKVAKAEEDLKKAQKVFDDLNVDLQDELPNLWDSRVGFYVNTFKSVSSLEAKFHREISVFCHKLYEVMNKLAEQHSDKMFTIQGAPSDSGPLRLARTPTPPEDESPEDSPVVSPNHTLRPTSPGPPRPKSPSQLKMGPPKPPPPKVTPTKEMPQEQIINLFDGGFPEISVTSPQPNEKPTESLLDLDFDPFKPDSNQTIGQTQSSASQALSWDLWTTNTEAQPASDAGFNANWTADFGSAAQDLGDVQPATDGQGWPPAEGWSTDTVPQGEATGEVDSSVPTFVADFDKMSEAPEGAETGTEAAPEGLGEGEGEVSPAQAPEAEGSVTTPPEQTTTEPAETTAASSPPAETDSSIVESSEAAETMAAEQTETTPVDETEKEQLIQASPEESAPVAERGEEPSTEALAPAEDKESPIEETPTIDNKPEDATSTVETKPEDETATLEVKPEEETGTVEIEPEGETGTIEVEPEGETGTIEVEPEGETGTIEVKPEGETGTIEVEPEGETGTVEIKPGDETSKEGASKNFEEEEKMPIPSVVIEPASSNEGDDDRDGDIISPIASSEDGVTPDNQTAKDISSSGMPPGFLYKVETMHDFEAANPDELELKRGDIVLVVPTELVEDQDAGWLTGIRESDWLHQGASAQKGLFPENFIQRMD
ncbi:amphiphysin isoform X1 [Ictalurus punctatus]|uniref:Amphiphysin isoform X1 n=1 Tax=Ictalurus punctatus TaxID=7998 RepID=A0A2D0R961_ICTPU|nr:amphiphysin isoform X1 [Ictalurus punctatus]